ncbi:hypothetical protein HDG69_003364 [Isoptericola halotolerans]|uniref:Uncharacterized protein n=1 Tax=Isoptericola halotolerans TaxID=300560 RepID=A0ABX2A801_9MICO|nr:hypothetical protein [Isoptericola halotolerans]
MPGIFPGARVTDSGQGAVFQYRREFVDAACDFLHR